MIMLLEGVPGAGKSFWGVGNKLIPWLKAGRRLYVYIDGAHRDKWALFLGVTEEELSRRVTVWKTAEEVLTGIVNVEPNSAVFIDEAQSIFRAKAKLDLSILRWLETHRHIGVDICLTCQGYAQLTLGVLRLVESTIKFRKLWFVGLEKRAQAFLRGQPEDTEIVRKFTFVYTSNVYAWYKSYGALGIQEEKRGGSVWMTPTIIIAGAAAMYVMFVLFGHEFYFASGVKKAQAFSSPASSKVEPSKSESMPVSGVTHPMLREPLSKKSGMCIEGVIGPFEDGHWVYSLSSGRAVTAEELSHMTGKPVHQEMDAQGFQRVQGEGVDNGPCDK